ncbi:hypothetical protein CD798_09855 [Bacillaceae bacterium SAOS 7]|nr:hypothetical protein CD798_09855 [Bacillaceae bacterium SAOS 7]
MNMKENRFLIQESDWMDKFNKVSINWIDKYLIELILKSLDISNNQFRRFIGDAKDWPAKINKINKKTKKIFGVSYPNIRDAADFLAIPPWLLFYRDNKGEETEQLNQQIINMFQNTPPHLPVYKIYYYDEVRKVTYYDKGDVIEDEPYQNLSKRFGDESYSHQSIMEGTWKEIFRFLESTYKKNDKLDFSGAASIYVEENSRYIRLGTVRFKTKNHFAVNPMEMKKYGRESYWSTAWFAIDLKEKQLEKYEDFIEGIYHDISFLIGCYPCQYQVQNEEKIIKLYSWHTLRTKESEEYIIQLGKIVGGKLQKSKYPLELSIANIKPEFKMEKLQINNREAEILGNYVIKTIRRDLKSIHSSRRASTLNLLFKEEKIQDGTKIELDYKVIKSENLDKNITKATVMMQGSIPKVKWDYDGELYYITPLTRKIFELYNVKPKIKQNNGNIFWGVVGEEKSLYDIAKQYC